jgi:putative phosphoribosyl transferase
MPRSREQGGRLLARELGHLRADDPIVLGITRGGVGVAFEVARALDAPLDLMPVLKVGAPDCVEHTIAAVAEGGVAYVHHDALHDVEMSEAEAAELAEQAAHELERRVRGYRGDGAPPDLAGRTVILVDDGVATGTTACAAARSARRRGARRLVLASPVVAANAAPELTHEVDELVALERPLPFLALCVWYEQLEPVSDDDVVACLQRSRSPLPRREADRIWEGETSPAVPPASPLATEVSSITFEDGAGAIEADLIVPGGVRGVVLFGTASTRDSPRYRIVSRALHGAGVGSLRCDLFTPDERRHAAARGPLNPGRLTRRILTALRWLSVHPVTRELPLGVYGAGASAEACLLAAAAEPRLVDAVVLRAGQLDTIPAYELETIHAPTLLVVGSRDENVLSANRAAVTHLPTADLAEVPGVTDLFGEPGALEAVGRLAADWFRRWLERPTVRDPSRPARFAEPSSGARPGH